MRDDEYFEWLYGQVASRRNRNPARTYWKLLWQLFLIPFDWFVANDDNRAEDGNALRQEFLQSRTDYTQDWLELECSVLEMLIALARRISFEIDMEPMDAFWMMLENIDLSGLSDAVYSAVVVADVEVAIERVVCRSYNPDGSGGLFPLTDPYEDQRNVELWYQMSAYVLENMDI